jgi:hypothetical protein
MKTIGITRRTLLGSALALPLVKSSKSMVIAEEYSMEMSGPAPLYSGLPGLDYALGGIGPGELVCISGPPCTSKTLMLLELASRISARYRQNVLFYSAHKPSVYIAKKAALKGGISIHLWEDRGTRPGRPAVYLLDSNTADTERAIEVAVTLQSQAVKPETVVIMDGWSSHPRPAQQFQIIDGTPYFPSERWAHTLLSREQQGRLQEFTSKTRLPVVLGVSTASLVDDEALAASRDLESEIRCNADHWVRLYRPELYKVTADVKPKEWNVVELTGTNPRWGDTRCSKLRFDPRDLSFSTIT